MEQPPQIPYETASSYRGVSYNRRGGSKPWKTTLYRCGELLYVGSYPDTRSAAQAYDNAVFYLQKYHNKRPSYNFPAEWTGPAVPAPLPEVERLIVKLKEKFPQLKVEGAKLTEESLSKRLDDMADVFVATMISHMQQLRQELKVASSKLRVQESMTKTDRETIERLQRTIKGMEALGPGQHFAKIGGETVPATPVDAHLS